MNHSVAARLAASTLVLGVTMVGCTPSSQMARPAALSSSAPRADRDAAELYAQAQEAMRQGRLSDALAHTEDAVALAPRDVGYRMLLGDLYLKSGRFQSAETTFDDVLTLDPANARASLSIALAQVALGKTYAALTHLNRLSETAAPGDIGLAYALVGETDRAIALLEPAARAPDADARVRQNLALAYALAGDWLKARTTAAQDISPAQLGDRMEKWAAFAKPEASWTQVAGLLGVTPAADPGQPVRLALAPETDSVRFAEATVAAPPVEAVPTPPLAEPASVVAEVEAPALAAPVAPLPAQVAYAPPPEPDNAVISVPTPIETPDMRFPEVVQTLVDPEPAVLQPSAPVIKAAIPAFQPARKAPRIAGRAERRQEVREKAAATPSRFVVQIGAFSTPANVERAWVKAIDRFPAASERMPLSTTVTIPGRGMFYRLSVSGFDTRGDANALCGTIRAKGGACFVRETAGDAPVRWASRYTRNG